ncbi:flavin reductase family protein [Streptomyces sp. NPDC048664]|uniref:flavin reductase family protein n=1 Tax=Streptomyces sp. NPDC048664 TaxID=3154505 RepID=UPI0034132F50
MTAPGDAPGPAPKGAGPGGWDGAAAPADGGPGGGPGGGGPDGDAGRALRAVLGRYATGVAVVTCRGAGGEPAGMTVNSFTSVSLDPPLILWCLARSSRGLPAFTAAEHFAVHVLAADQRDLAARFSGPGDRFAGLATVPGPHEEPLLPGAAATLCCRNAGIVPAGDHLLLLGAVEHHARTARRALLFADGAYHAGPAPVPGRRGGR